MSAETEEKRYRQDRSVGTADPGGLGEEEEKHQRSRRPTIAAFAVREEREVFEGREGSTLLHAAAKWSRGRTKGGFTMRRSA